MSVVVKKIGDMSVKVISADDIASIRREISSRDMEMDKRAVAAVNSAINRAQVCNTPIAKYDLASGRAYLEYADGSRDYVN